MAPREKIGSGQVGPFGLHAKSLRQAGFAVLPSNLKKPYVGGFNKWRAAPGGIIIDGWINKFPDADIMYAPGLSRVDPNGEWRTVVLDGDDAGAVQQIKTYFGDTPGRVNTRRGRHFLYRVQTTDILKVREIVGANSSLKPYGINADIKFGTQLVVAPPSRHEKQADFIYGWDGCDPSVIHDLLPLDLTLLGELVQARKEYDRPSLISRPAGEFPEGSRGLMLNKLLCSHAAHCESFDELLDIAATINEGFQSLGYEPLDDAEVTNRTRQVWKDFLKGKIEVRHNRRARGSIDGDELDHLLKLGGPGCLAAIVFLLKLRIEHGGRMARGEAFAISDYAMAKARTLPGFGRNRIRGARDVLIELGYLERTAAAVPRKVAAQYRLIAQHVGQSLALRRLQP